MRRFVWILFAAVLAGIAAPVSAAPPLEAYGTLPAIDLVSLSPSGKRIAFIAFDGVKRRIFARQVGGDALLIQDVGDSKVRGLRWAGEDFLLIDARVTSKLFQGLENKWNQRQRYELRAVLVANLKTKEVRPVFDPKKMAFSAVFFELGEKNIGGRWYGFYGGVTGRVGYDPDIYRVDLESGEFKVITDESTRDYDQHLIGPDGSIAARADYRETTGTWRALIGAHGDSVIVQKHAPYDEADIEGFGRTRGTILVSQFGDAGDTFEEFPFAAGGQPTRLWDGQDVDVFLYTSDDRLIGAASNSNTHVMLLDPAMQRKMDAIQKAFPGVQVSLTSWSDDFGTVVVFTDGGNDSGAYWLVNLSTGKADELTTAYPQIGPADVAPTKLFTYKASEGTPIEAILTLPPGRTAQKLPLVVLPHGGPIGVRDRQGFDWWAQAFASRGYAVLQPNYRGSGGYGAAFRKAGFGQWGHKMLTDIADGVGALAAQGTIDAKRACIVGASYGGYAALAGVTVQHGLYRCAVSLAGPSDAGAIMNDLTGGWLRTSERGRYGQALFGALTPGKADVAAISPVRRADEADAPILLIHGEDDTVVSPLHTESMRAALAAAGKPVEYLKLEHEDHSLSHEATRIQMLKASVAFVEKYNPPD